MIDVVENPAQDLLDIINPQVVLDIARRLSKEIDGSERHCGVIAVAHVRKKDGAMWFASRGVGILQEGGFKYAKNAAEKIARLRARRVGGHHEFASSQSADETNPDPLLRTYGGCLVFEGGEWEIYISYSGAPPKVDEVTVFITGEIYGLKAARGYQNELIPRARQIYEARVWRTV